MNVETVDYQDPGARVALQRSLRDTGFAVLANHPITAERITTIYDGWGVFFADDKNLIMPSSSRARMDISRSAPKTLKTRRSRI